MVFNEFIKSYSYAINLKTSLTVLLLCLLAVSCTNKNEDNFNHVLLLEFSKDSDIDIITKDVLKFEEIESVKQIRFGAIKPHQRNKIHNFSHCLILTFKNEQGLQEYLKDPYHEEIAEKHKTWIANIYMADFNDISSID